MVLRVVDMLFPFVSMVFLMVSRVIYRDVYGISCRSNGAIDA